LLVLILVFVVFAAQNSRFLTVGSITSVAYTAVILVIAALGQTIVVLTGNFDLSVGSIMGLTAYIVYSSVAGHSWLGPLVVVTALVLGAVLGLFNGLLVGVLRVPSIIATLGTMSIYAGLSALYAGNGEVISSDIPNWVSAIANGSVFGVPYYVFIALVVVVVVAFVLTRLPWGRRLYAFGSNPQAATELGLSRTRILISAYVGAGVLAAFAGLLLGAQVGNFEDTLGSGYEIEVLAAVVVGGVSVFGGSGSAVGAALGAAVLATVSEGLILLQVQEYYVLIVQGAAIVVAVAVDAAIQLAAGRRLMGLRRASATDSAGTVST
jgi:rhamnose transport system permease protein